MLEDIVLIETRMSCSSSQNLFGEVLERTVLYRGEDCDLAGGIRYRNVNAYLKTLKRCH